MNDKLFNLLPAIYRLRDTERGFPLRAMLSVIEAEFDRVQADIEALQDDAFIETAADWVVPYIGDLLGVRPLRPGVGNPRAYVANTLAYRRRKGTAAVLEQLARDVTGLPARAVEFFELLHATQNVNHTRPLALAAPDLRDATRLELSGTPFDPTSHLADVRAMSRGGRYNIPNVGLFLWRLRAYAVERGEAHKVSDGCFTFDPLGRDAPLFNPPQTETDIAHLAEPQDTPEPLRRRALSDDLARAQQAAASIWFGEQPALRVFASASPGAQPLAPSELTICNLRDFRKPPSGAAVDPQLGRIAFADGVNPTKILVSFAYGFNGDIGGGPYPRALPDTRRATWQVGVSAEHTAVSGEAIFTIFEDAVKAWNAQPDGSVGVIVLMDSRTYETGATPIRIGVGSQLLIVAASWPKLAGVVPNTFTRRVGQLAMSNLRPCLVGDLAVSGDAASDAGELCLDGLLVSGAIRVGEGNLGGLRVSHCTLGADADGVVVSDSADPAAQNQDLRASLAQCVAGRIALAPRAPDLVLRDSLIRSVEAEGVALDARAVTVFGETRAQTLAATDCIFVGAAKIERRQVGCVRFSFVAEGSRTPRRYRCQPDMALGERARELKRDLTSDEAKLVRARVRPAFTSTRVGDPAFGQLSAGCVEEIRAGGEGGSEMGAFASQRLPLAEANLRDVLDEYLPFGLTAGVVYAT